MLVLLGLWATLTPPEVQGQEVVTDSLVMQVYGQAVGFEVEGWPNEAYVGDTVRILYEAVDAEGEPTPASVEVLSVSPEVSALEVIEQTDSSATFVVRQQGRVVVRFQIIPYDFVRVGLLHHDTQEGVYAAGDFVWDDFTLEEGHSGQGCAVAYQGDPSQGLPVLVSSEECLQEVFPDGLPAVRTYQAVVGIPRGRGAHRVSLLVP